MIYLACEDAYFYQKRELHLYQSGVPWTMEGENFFLRNHDSTQKASVLSLNIAVEYRFPRSERPICSLSLPWGTSL